MVELRSPSELARDKSFLEVFLGWLLRTRDFNGAAAQTAGGASDRVAWVGLRGGLHNSWGAVIR
jgi:hypothetical protein